MDFISATVYGIIQGLTEFLPISSSGHLALLPHLLKIKDPGIIFDISMHIGTALSVMVYFREDIQKLWQGTLSLGKAKETLTQEQIRRRFWATNMIISTIATFILALLLKGVALEYGRTRLMICFNLAVFGIFMLIADLYGKRQRDPVMNSALQVKKAIMIGVFQAFALFPGVSRSGATLTISRMMHLSRLEACNYSFLLSLPVILGAFVFKFRDLMNHSESIDVMAYLIGGGVSFVTGILTIHFFLKLIGRIGLSFFSIYRIILAIAIAFS